MKDKLAQGYERFVDDGNEEAFEAVILNHGGIAPPSKKDYPLLHRIRDVFVCGEWYRITRLYDIDDRSSRLFIYPTDLGGGGTGVPYVLTGKALHQWVIDELEKDEPDDDNDWGRYVTAEHLANASVQLAQGYERFVKDGNEAAFQTVIHNHGGIAPSSELQYPFVHRVCDVFVCDEWYRIVRLYDIDDRSSCLFIYPNEKGGGGVGVPYELSGESLHQWVMDELAKDQRD